MSISRKFQRSKSKYTLSQKIISAVTAAGFIMQPIVGFAQSINKVNNNGSIEVNGNVTNIWADKVVSNSAVNVFKDFQLDANNIANMYFNTKRASGADAANLVNFVNSRIDINGTVNAIQNSQIGGNLFFLSKDGMAVGKSGVINTGSLYVMTPTQDFMDAAKTIATTAPDETAADKLAHITNITTDAASWQAIPLNSSGTITVLGKVNAVNEVRMRAAKIGVGKNVDDSVVDNVSAGEIAAKNAHIETGITDFSNIVNINYKDESGKDVAVNSGITNLTATKTGSGDIVLEAYVDASDDKNAIEKLPVIGGTTLGTTAESVENTFTEQEFAASVDIYGKVNATGKADISATAINSNADFDETLNDYKANNNDVAQLATVKADVNIGGTVKAADDVNIKAEAVNRYVDNTGGFAKALSVGISSGTPLTGDVAYSVLNTEANVNVASGANVASENGSVDIDAKAETLAASAASTTGLKFKAAGGLTGANVPATAVVYTGVDNRANVTVEGNIKAGKDISIDADADMKVEADNKMSLKGKMANQFVVGVTVAGAENSASVDIKGSGNKVSAVNDLSVNAKADSDFTSSTSIKAPEASAITVAVNVTDFNSNANVNVDTDLTAGNNLNVEADNTIVSDNVNAETKLGSNKYISAATQVVTTNAEGKITEVKNFINGLKTKLGFEAGGSDDIKTQLQLSEILKAGATVTYSGQEHKSGVNIGKNGSLTAQNGMLGVNAETLIEDAHIAATGTTYSYNDAYPAGATLNASVLVNNMDNSSSVVVADREEGSADALKGKNGVSVNASTRFEYNRIQNMIQDVKDAYNQIATATASLDDAIKKDFVNNFLDPLQTQIKTWEIAFKTADETLATSDSGVLSIGEAAKAGYSILNALNNLNTMLDSTSGSEVADATKASIQGASDLLTSALAFADPNSYGNFAASSASKGSSGNQSTVGGHIPSAINGAGTVIVNNVDTVSKVEIGSNTGIASDRDVNINAESFMKDVTLGGLNAVPITNSGGGTTASIGATVNYSDFNTDTVVAVNNGASITGRNINIAGSNVIDHVSVAGSAGIGPSGETQSGGIVLNGMLSFVNGSSDILTVVDDGASLTAKQNEYTETVKDEETGEEKETKKYTEGNISITGHNNSNIVNVAAGLNFGTGSGAVGVGLAYTDFAVKNIAGVADVAGQINNLYSYKDDNGEVAVGDSKVAELDGELNNTYTATASTDTKGSISAYGFNVDAATEGSIQSVSVAASASKNDDTGETSFFGKIKGSISNTENKLLGSGGKLDTVTGRIFGTESGKANDFFNMGSNTHGANAGGINLVGGTSGKGGFMPSFSIAGSGSVSMNMLDNATQAIVDNAKISMKSTDGVNGDIRVTARDTAYAGAYSGAAALQWKSGGSASDTSVGFSGAAGVNDIDNVIKATISNSVIDKAGTIDTLALSGGEQLALGLGLNVAKSGSTSGYTGNAAVSVNLIDHDVEALHENNTVTSADDINVAAYARDIENTGGGSLSAGQQKVGVGASVGVAMLNNNITAGIKGGSYKDVGNVDVEALNALQNITVGIAAGLTLPSSGSGASAVVEGAGVYNEVHNTTKASIEGSDSKGVEISTISTAEDETGNVNVTAQDVAVNEKSIYEKTLAGKDGKTKISDGKEEVADRMGENFDITGKNELDGVDKGDIENELNKNKADNEKEETVELDKNTGSSIITVAGGLAATTGKGAGGAAVAITDIENTYTADVKYADITADELDVDAGSNSNIVTVAGGIAAANKGSGVGSVSWNDVINTANVNIANSHIYAQQTTATAANQAQIVSVGGQISGAGKAAVGATLSYVGLDNTTKVNISTTEFDERTANEGTSVTAKANNTSDSYNIGAGVSAAGDAAVSGTVVVTQTKGTAGAVMDGAKINNAKEIIAHASDDTDILSVIGTVNIAGKAAVGAGVAYTEIGGVSDDKEKAEQHVTAEIKNSTINTIDTKENEEKAAVNVTAKDTARVINVAVGIGGAGTAAVQGASATSLINKTTGAELTNSNIDKDSANSQNANVTVDAQNNSEITSSASTVAVAGSGAGVGAGIAVNRIIQQTNAAVTGGTMNVNNLKVNANATPRIENIGVGGGIAGTGAGISGSVAVNMIENDVSAHIGSGANIVADGSVGVVATSDEQISNYAGQLAVGGVGAGVGVSVSVNQIAGTTSATVGGEGEDTTSVTAKGNDSIKTNTGVNVANEINKTLIDKETVAIDSKIDRTEESRSGLIVDASSTRDLKSFLITAGVAGTGAGVTGTVNVNQIDGKTTAGITNTTVNGGSTAAVPGNNANVTVNAGDYSNMSGFVGSAAVGGIGAGVGLASDTNTINREVTASVDKSDIKAQGFEVDADSAQGISSFGVGAGAAGVGGGAAGVVTVTELNNTTKAMLNNSKVNANTVSIKANHTGIVNAGNVSVGGAGLGVGGGLSVGVLKDNSATEVTVKGDNTEEDTITASGDVTIAANNNATVNPMISANGVGGMAGVAGATSINNLNSTVKTNIESVGITSTGGSISGTADNTFNVKAYMGTIGGGAVGAGAGVTVNTIDSTVQTNVNGSALDAAKDITLTAQETRNIEQTATNVAVGGIAVGANIAITTVGQKVENVIDENGKIVSNAADKIDEANKVFINEKTGEDNSGDLLAGAGDALETAGIDSGKATPHVDAGYGGGKDSQITVNITNSNIEADSTVTAKATETDKINMTLGSGSAGAAAVNAGVGILNVHRNVGVNITGGNITVKNAVELASVINGSSNLQVYQGTAGLLGVNAAYGGATSTGTSGVTISSGTINGGSINILAEDAGRTNVETIGITAGVISPGTIIAEGTNKSQTTVNVSDTEMNSDADIDIKAEHQAKDANGNKLDTLSVSAKAGSGGLIFAGVGVGATANELGKVGVTVNNGSNLKAGNAINITALNAPSVSAATGAVSGSMLASGAITVAEANIGTHIEPEDKENENKEDNGHLKTFVNITEGNSFTAKSLTAEARADAAQNVKMEGLSLSASLLPNGALQANTGGAEVYSDVEVNVGENVFKGSDTEAAANGIDLDISGVNSVDQEVNATGISVSTVFASGTNIADSSAQLSTQVQVDGPSEDSEINNVDLNASSYAKVDTDANGYGGAIAEASPYAAKVNNNYTADTDVIVNGDWNTAGSFDAQAVNGMDIDLKSDAVRAAVVGLSGTWLDNTINNAANVTVNNANITTGGAQSYIAQNTVDYNGEIDGSGYGGINVNATDYSDDLDFTAGVDIKGSNLRGAGDGGSITAFAGTQGSISSKNGLKSAGVIPIALAFSNHEVDYNNSVNVVNSDLTTDKADADITLAATDDTDVKLETIADTQGGVAGAASAEASNDFNRANKINIDANSNLLSTKDINLYAGADANGTKSSLNLQVLADAYNKTAIPVYTDPKVDNSMTQKNQIELAGNAESVRHINASAQKGTTTVTESAQEYKVWTGTSGEGQVASTALGDTIKNEKADNYVNITGNAEAGIHNELDITIGGQTTTTDPVRDEDGKITTDGSVSYDKDNITINAGGDWFTKDDIKVENLTVINGLMERYNQVIEYLKAYDKNSEAYKAYEAEKNLLLLEMQKAGFAEKAGENDELVPLPSVELPAVEIPDIVVSGGNINIEADEFKGDGGLIANGAPQLTITNESDMYLKVNDLTISDNGGLINVDVENKNSFSGTQQADGISDNLPTITIDGASADKNSFGNNKLVQADIGIFGDITNSAGDVKITSDNYNILVNGNVSGRNITIAATKGNITQQSSEGVLNIGNDPIARLQLSETVAEKIQNYLYGDRSNGSKSFADYQEYLGWLIETVGVTFSDLGLQEDIGKYLTYNATDEEIFNAVDKNNWWLSDSQVQQRIENAKAGGIESWKDFLNDNGITCSYNLGNIESALAKEDTGTIAGGNIYMDAVNINIGGLIQSGYASYSTTLTDADKARVDALDKDWQSNRKVLTDTDVMGNDKYLVNEGGQHFNNETGLWEYEVKVYYNPSTGQLLTESVRPEGGNIQISGKVSSTGGGRIMAMDGTSDVSIDTTAVGKDVKVNSITVNDITGLISIADKNTGKTTQYRNGQQRTFETGKDAESVAWTTGSNSYTYNPEEGSQFAWTGGVSGERIEEYSYKEDFLFWGALPYNKSEDLLEHIANVGGTIETGSITTNAGDPLKDGSLITGGYTGGDNMLTISWTYKDIGEPTTTDPHSEKEYDGTAGKIFGYGEFIYTWTKTQGDQMASTSGLKADHGIQIGFLGNGAGEGNIKVDSAQDMLLNGNISNATIVDDNNNFAGKGSVTLNSNSGSVSAIGSANINSDDVNIKAATGVDVNHAAIGDTANINVATDSGDISFVSSAGDLKIEQMITGITYKDDGTIDTDNIDASTGSVYLEAQGDILDAAKGDYTVKGQRIDLVSHTGSIGTKDKALTVLGGSELYSSDAMASSVNAQANGDIVLTQVDGNMRFGTIVSNDGDAVLTVNNGSFVDAHPSENNDNSSAQDKIDRWLEAGLIVEKDAEGNDVAADDSTASAKQAKDERVNALTNRMEALAAEGGHSVEEYKNAADAFYKDEGISAAKAAYLDAVAKANSITEGDQTNEGGEINVADAYAKYQAAQKAYFADKGFSEAEQETIINYAEVANSDNYGWSKNQLLYAIQDSVLNTKPGEVQTVETPNVTANNITLNAEKGSIGIDGKAKYIKYDELNNEANLKILAAAKAGDLTWDNTNNQVVVRQQQAITVSVKSQDEGQTYGKVNVTGRDNVYLAGVKDTELNINGVTTAGDIRLQGDEGVNVDGTLTGVDLTINGGTGNIMGVGDDHYVNTNISGVLDANSAGDIYINQTGDLNILAIAAGQAANLKAANNILMHNVEGSQAQGYINANIVNLEAGANIGSSDNAIRILDNGAAVNADAKDNIYLSGVDGTGSTDELILGTIKGANLDVTSVSDISLGRDNNEGTEEDETVNSNVNVGSGNVSLTTNDGSITQTADSKVTADSVNASATENILLGSEANRVNNFVVNGAGEGNNLNGDVTLVSAANNTENIVKVDFAKGEQGLTVNGTVTVNALGDSTELNITGGSLTTTNENDGDVTFTSAGSITADTTVNSAANIVMDADGAITNNGALTAQDNVTVNTTEGAIEIGGSVTATDNDVNITTGSGAISTTGAISGGTNVKVDAGTTGTIDLGGDVTAEGGNVDVTTDDGYIKTTGAVTANNDVNVDTLNGAIDLGGLVDAETGFVNVSTANGSITTGGYVSGHKDVTLNSDGGDITVGGYTESETQNVTATVKGDGNISFAGTVSASGDVEAEVTGEGDITTGTGAEVSGTDITFTTNDGNITTGSDLTADKNIDLNVNTGNITFGGDVTANDGNITIDITGDGSLTYDKDAENADNTLTAIGQEGSEDSGNIIINLKGEGDVDLYDLYATNNARLDIANGNLTLHEINGELVAMQLRTEGREMDVDKITAGTQIVLTGSDMSLDNIAQRPDADGMLVVTPDGAQADKPIDNFTIGNIQTNAGSGIRFDRLWVNNSDIHISEGQLWFDKLYVENMAHFSNSNMVAGIYGVPPLRDGSDSVYWINTEENRPESSLDMWLNGTGDWMYLRFTDDHIQESNGILLTLDEYDYVYDQRFTAENHLRWQHGRYLDEDWKQAYGYGLSLHNRYGLIDYQDFTEENAGEDEIAVEA